MIDRLVLGTAQLGMPYGINNKIGKPDFNNACDIIKASFDYGVTRFDTAQAYGDSEEILGKVFDELKICQHVKVYSKLHPTLNLCDEKAVRSSVEDSLRKLRVDRLEGILLHHEDGMRFWDKDLGVALRGLVAQGKVKSIGVSFYTPKKALEALDVGGIDMIQVPANILDSRFEDAGIFRKAKDYDKKIFVRSVFLQGLLLMPLDIVPIAMKCVLPYLKKLERMASSMGLSRQELVLGYAAWKWGNSFVLFGAESRQQVVDNVKAFSSKIESYIDEDIFYNVPENILNPALWPKL